MEDKLKKAFDYQHFEENSHLGKVIRKTEAGIGAPLTDDELASVNAAGTITQNLNNEDDTTVKGPDRSVR